MSRIIGYPMSRIIGYPMSRIIGYPMSLVIRPQLVHRIDEHDAMEMIRHDYVFVQGHRRKTVGQLSPIFIYDFADRG
ncbi:MAG: hypothetical protein QNJ97_20245 [Myxococcota bacterium]|nr:hypothetical protein [Myxococcota bacterium]